MITKSTQSKLSVPLLLKVVDVCALLNVSRNTVNKLIDRGELTACYLFTDKRMMNRHHIRITGESFSLFYGKQLGSDRAATSLDKQPKLQLAR